MILYISELTHAQFITYQDSFYQKVDYALRGGTSCFADLVNQSMEDIDAMEIGGFPAYYARRPVYDRPSDAQVAAQRAVKRMERRRKGMKRMLQEMGACSAWEMADRLIELAGDDMGLLEELADWVERGSGLLREQHLLQTGAANLQETEREVAVVVSEVVSEMVERVCCEVEAAAAAAELQETKREVAGAAEAAEDLQETEREGAGAVAAAAVTELQETEREVVVAEAAEATPYDELWPALPTRSIVCRQFAAAAGNRGDLKKSGNAPGDLKKKKASIRPRQSRIAQLLQQPHLLPTRPISMIPLFAENRQGM